MNDVARQTFLRLMQDIEELEDKLARFRAGEDTPENRRGIGETEAALTEKRRELARRSDGCTRPQHR